MDMGSNPKVIPEFTGLQVNTAVQSLPIPLIYGSPRCNLNLIYYNGFQVVQQQQQSGKGVLSGGKGGGGSPPYYATLIMALGEGPISAVTAIYQDSAIYTPTTFPTNGSFFFTGSDVQAPWSYIVSKWPNDARPYKDVAYYGFPNAQLDSSATVPQIGIVPVGILSGSSPLNNSFITITSGQYDTSGNPTSFIGNLPLGTCDADPGQVLLDILTNTRYGAGFPAAFICTSDLISSAQAYDPNYGDAAISTYCQAVGLAWSLLINNADSCNTLLDRLCNNLNVAPVWDGALLRFIPYWDQFCGNNPGWYSGNGIAQKYFNPYLQSICQIGLNDILQPDTQDDDPIQFSRKNPQLVFNTVRMSFKDRTNFFNDNPVEAKDEVHAELYGSRIDNIGTATEFTLAAYANVAAQMRLRHNIATMRSFTFRLNPLWAWLCPMQLVQIPDPINLSSFITVRIQAVEDQEDETVIISADEFTGGAVAPTLIPVSPTTPPDQGQTNVPAAPAFPPVIFEPTSALLTAQNFSTNQVLVGVSGGYNGLVDGYYGGCFVWVSTDGVHYEVEGQVNGPSAIGVLSAPLPAYGGGNPDNTDTLIVNMAQSGLTLPSTSAAAAAAFRSIFVVKDATGYELMSYTSSVMSGFDTYSLTGLYRGLYGTTSRTFGPGAQFLCFQQGSTNFLETALSSTYIGKTIYIKLQAYNAFNNSTQSLSACQVYQYIVTGPGGAYQIPPMKAPRRPHGFTSTSKPRKRNVTR